MVLQLSFVLTSGNQLVVEPGVVVEGVQEDARGFFQLVEHDEFHDAVDVGTAVTHVGRDDVGILDIEHAAVGATADHVLGRLKAGTTVSFLEGSEHVPAGSDGVEVVDRCHDVTADLDFAAPALGDALGLLDGPGDHLVGFVPVEAPGSDVEDGLGRPAFDVGDVEEGRFRIVDAGVRQVPVLGHQHGEVHGGVVTGIELVGVLAGVGITALEDHLEDAAVEAADVDGAYTAAVYSQEHVPAVDQFGVQLVEAELADLLVAADPDGEGTVDSVVSHDLVEGGHDDGHTGLVIATQEGAAVGSDDALALETLEVGGGDDHAVLR